MKNSMYEMVWAALLGALLAITILTALDHFTENALCGRCTVEQREMIKDIHEYVKGQQ